MSEKKIEVEIKSLISKIFNITVKKISSSTTSKDIPKWDSIGQIRLILLIESKYKIKINQKMYDKLLSFDKIVKYLKKHK